MLLKIFAVFTRKLLSWSISFNKLARWRPAALLKTDSSIGDFMWILKVIFKKETTFKRQLLLEIFFFLISLKKPLTFKDNWNRVGTVWASQGQKYLFHHGQGKSWNVKDKVRKSWTDIKWSGTILGKWDYLLNFGLVFQNTVYLYSWFIAAVNQGGKRDVTVRLKSIYRFFFWFV